MFGFKKKEETIYNMPAKKFDKLVKAGKLTVEDVMKRTAYELFHDTRGVLVLEKTSKSSFDMHMKYYEDNIENLKKVIDGSADSLALSLARDAVHDKDKDIAEKKESNMLCYLMGCVNTYANFEVWKKALSADINFQDVIRYIDDEELVKNALDRIRKAYSNPDEEIISRINKESVQDCIERTLRIARAMDAGQLPETCFNENGFLTREDGTLWETDYISQYKEFPADLVEEFFKVVDEKTGKRK